MSGVEPRIGGEASTQAQLDRLLLRRAYEYVNLAPYLTGGFTVEPIYTPHFGVYCGLDGRSFFTGLIQAIGAAPAAFTVLCQLPKGIWPEQRTVLGVLSALPELSRTRIDIRADGAVEYIAGPVDSLRMDNVSWQSRT